jgi:hypothetical protein
MNTTVIVEWWLASWEIKVMLIGTALAGVTAADLVPVLAYLPDAMAILVAKYWSWFIVALAFALRQFKTQSKLTFFRSKATPKAEVIAIKAATVEKLKLAA